MKLSIVYSGQRLEPRLIRSLPHLIIMSGDIEITQLIDASAAEAEEDRQRVINIGKLFRLQPERQNPPDFKSVDAVIIEIGSNPREHFKLTSVLSHAVESGVHVCLPYDALTSLPYGEVVDLFALAASRGVRILGCTRFLFGQGYTRFRERIINHALEFGTVRDANCRIGIGPVDSVEQLLKFSIHHINIIFDLLNEKPEAITAVSSGNPLYQPCINFTLLFARGKLANFFLTANRNWGRAYHFIEISGSNAYAATDLGTYKYSTSFGAGGNAEELNDDDQSYVIYGSAGKLKFFTTATDVAHFSKITKRSLWVYRILQDILTSDGIATRRFSCTDTADGWK